MDKRRNEREGREDGVGKMDEEEESGYGVSGVIQLTRQKVE